MYGYLAAVTRTLELVTGVIILPQRQTTLVAKQAADSGVGRGVRRATSGPDGSPTGGSR